MSLKHFLLYSLFIYLFLKYGFPITAPFLCAYGLARLLYISTPHSILFYFILLTFLIFLLLFLGYFVYIQLKLFYFELPAILQQISQFLKQSGFIEKMPTLFSSLSQFLPTLSNLLILLPKTLSFLTMTFFLTFLFLLDIHGLGRAVRFLSQEIYKKCADLQDILIATFLSMAKSSFLLFLITWLQCFIGLFLLRHPHSFFLSLIIACFDAMPLIGVGAVLIPLGFYEWMNQNPYYWGYILIYLIISTLRFFIEPKLLSHELNIPLLLHLFMLFICVHLFGWTGFLYSPILCVLLVFAYNQRKKS